LATERHTIEQRSTAQPGASPLARARAWLGGRPVSFTLVAGAALGASSLLVYNTSGYGTTMLLLWLGALAALSVSFWSISAALPRIAVSDLVTAGLLMVAFVPLYLVAIYRWPVQVSSDEQAILQVSRQYSDAGGVDPFGVSTYLGRPTLLFLFWGRAGEWLGGIDLYQMRVLHAVFGLLVVAASYALFRQLLERRWAIFAAVLLGSSHALFMISRLAMRENTAVLVEVVAFTMLVWGLRHDHALATFSGGFVAGLGYYVYFPGRATLPLWIFFLVLLALVFRSQFQIRRLARLGAIGVAGFILMAGPIMIAESKVDDPLGSPQKQTLLIYPEGRAVQQGWVFAPTIEDGIKTNIKWGLSTFNNDIVDHGWIYENHGHGFVDPLTGILLWIGVVIVGWNLIRRRGDPWSLLALGSFLVLWLSFAFVVNKAPNYTRLLITLPFVAYLVTMAVRALGERVERRYGVRHGVAGVALTAATAIVVWNLAIAWDYVQEGRREGDPIGSTGRYVYAHRDDPGQKFYIAADDGSWKYFNWGDPKMRVQLFAHEGQVGELVDPLTVGSFTGTPPFAIFMRSDVWMQHGEALLDRYPQARPTNITPDGRLIVVDVPKA
jgi:4-amino-4-deoxy-L-arabinose transferase-like glycosyltransferase